MQITNLTFDEIEIGDTTSYSRLITDQEVQAFAAISGTIIPCTLTPSMPPRRPLASALPTACSPAR